MQRPGPGKYNTTNDKLNSSQSVIFGTEKRELKPLKESSLIPGPGSYSPTFIKHLMPKFKYFKVDLEVSKDILIV